MVEEMYENYTAENNSDDTTPVFILEGEELDIPYFHKNTEKEK